MAAQGSGAKTASTPPNTRRPNIRTIGNIIWLVTGGLITAVGWLIAGIVFYITIVGIPLGRQCMKMASLTLTPFGLDIVYGGGAPSVIANIFWVFLVGIWMALVYLIGAACFCITIVGIPFGLQLTKMAKLSLFPFGAEVHRVAQ
jgi:uncharacterized membrane protein YccF (DUF307 family)